MALPSIDDVVDSASRSARRFPLVLLAAVIAAWASIVLARGSGGSEQYSRIAFVATLAVPLLFALTLFAERRAFSTAARWAILAAGIAALVWFGVAWPGWPGNMQARKYLQIGLAIVLMVAFLPFAGSQSQTGFWEYNKALVIRFVTSGVYSGAFYAGLAVAMTALEQLFGVPLPKLILLYLFIVLAFVFNTWFFLGGIPPELQVFERSTDYPVVLRKFTQLVLIPIVVLYQVILTIYLGKVLLTAQWPSGWIGYLVASVAAVGTLSWLLIYPLEDRAEYAWVRGYSRGFMIAILPSMGMLWMAISQRVGEYGVTESRYALIALSVWFTGIAIYYALTRSRNIQLIPASLCAVALLTFGGPWGMYAVSESSQVGRLRAILERDSLLAGEHLQPAPRPVSRDDRIQIGSILQYLLSMHGQAAISAWYSDSLRRVAGSGKFPKSQGAGAKAIMESLNLEYVDPATVANASTNRADGSFSYTASAQLPVVPIHGYTHAIRLSAATWRTVHDSLQLDSRTWLRLAPDSARLLVARDGANILEISLRPVLDSASGFGRPASVPAMASPLLHMEVRQTNGAALLYVTRMFGVRRANGPRVTSLEGELFLQLPPATAK